MGPFTAVTFLVALAHEAPVVYAQDPNRIAVIAVAAERAQSEILPQWERHARLLGAGIIVAALSESRLDASVHAGSRRGLQGEICLTQIHPINASWRTYAPSFEALAGIDIESTSWCLATGARTLMSMDRRCHMNGYRSHWLASMWTAYQFGGRCRPSDEGRKRASLTNRIAWTDWRATPDQVRLIETTRKQSP